MKTKVVALGFIAVTAGVFAYTRPHTAIPSDLRDAVADNGAFEHLNAEADTKNMDIPSPEVTPKTGDGHSKKIAVRVPLLENQGDTTITQKERELITRWAINDFLVDEKLSKTKRFDQKSSLDSSCMQSCVDKCSGGADCYKACTDAGYSFSRCYDRCGTTDGCYAACTASGYGFNTCDNKCGEPDGCYASCTASGQGILTCRNICGETNGCYAACTASGQGILTCKKICGETSGCYAACTASGQGITTCKNICGVK